MKAEELRSLFSGGIIRVFLVFNKTREAIGDTLFQREDPVYYFPNLS